MNSGRFPSRVLLAIGVSIYLSSLTGVGPIEVVTVARAQISAAIELNNAGVKALNAHNYPLAISKFEAAIKMDPTYRLSRENLAIAYNNYGLELQNNPSEGIKQFHKALVLNPGNATTLANLEGIITMMRKNPNSEKDRLALAIEARGSGDFEGAIIEYQAALQIKDDPKVHAELGDVYRVRDMYDKAIDEYKASLRSQDSAEVEVKLGQAYQARKDLPDAIAAYGRAIRLKSDYPEALNALKAGWEEALSENPLAPENHIGLGQAMEYLGDFDQANAEYLQAMRFDSNNQIARRQLAHLDQARNDWVIKKHIDAGVDLQTRQLYDQAIAEYKLAIAADPSNAVAWFDLGSCYQQKQSFNDAIDAYNRALKLDPSNEAAQQGIKAATAAKQTKDPQNAGKPAHQARN